MSETGESFRDTGTMSLEIDVEGEIKKIQKRIGNLPRSVASKALVNALNMAGRKTRSQMVKDAKGEYSITNKKILTDAAEGAPKYSAARGNFESSGKPLEGKIISRGPVRDIMDYMTRPNSDTAGAMAKVFEKNTLKEAEKPNASKAFSAKLPAGTTYHVAIVARIKGRKYTEKGRKAREAKYGKGADMTRVEKLLSPAVPHLLKNEKVRAEATSLFRQRLDEAIEIQIEKALKKFSEE